MNKTLMPCVDISVHAFDAQVYVFHAGLRCTSEWTLTVDGTEAHWKNGRCLVFDDSFLHHVSHNRMTSLTLEHCEEARAVLILDLWHPTLTRIERQVLSELFPVQMT